MKLLLFIGFVAFLSPFGSFAQEEKEVFLIEKEIKHLPVISQGRTGTCWSFATTSFLESEIMRIGKQETDLSEMYFVKYGENGLMENEPYSGVFEMLEELDGQGKKLYIATSKLEKYALKIMQNFEFDKYIIQLNGADYSGKKATKSAIITSLLETQQLAPSKDIVMIGDTVFDIEGGKENGLSTIAVNYGFGKEDDLRKADPDYFVEDVEELYEILAG